MSIAADMPATIGSPLSDSGSCETTAVKLAAALKGWFDVEFSILDGSTGEPVCRNGRLPCADEQLLAAMVRRVAEGGTAEFVADEDPVLVLAIPIAGRGAAPQVAVAAFATRRVGMVENISGAARLLGLDPRETANWINRQTVFSGQALLRLASVVSEKLRADAEIDRLKTEVEKISHHLSSTYEEISLLYGVTQKLRLTSSVEELGRLTLDWLNEVVPARGLVIQHLSLGDDRGALPKHRAASSFLTFGDCPIDNAQFSRLVRTLGLSADRGPLVANDNVTRAPSWLFPEIRQLIVVSLAEAQNVFGWLAAINHSGGEEFGTVEASLLSSVGAILGIHLGNIELYRQQADFVTSVVRALTSAIDAKDPYTCGHSERVARVAVRLAQQLGVKGETLNTLYMAGLLHDVGKIGIDDSVLRKPGRLTDDEFNHIKKHPELGHKILRDLRDLKQLGDVLTVVHFHHERWDGGGYPHGLAGEEVPLLARIVAVADAFDAMSSDRPYRKGMPDEKVDRIFREGAGRQWDPRVVAAFFETREDVGRISHNQRSGLFTDTLSWT